MGTRGPVGKRDAERMRRNKKPTSTTELGREDLEALPFEVDLNPEPPEQPGNTVFWNPIVQQFWDSLQSDPARKWMTSADWAAAMLFCESMSRELEPQVTAVSKEGEITKDYVPIKSATLAAFLKFLDHLGITEAARMRMQKEITLFPSPAAPELASVTDITASREEEVQ